MRQIKSKLLFNGIKPPFRAKQSWSTAYMKWLKEFTCDSELLRLPFDYLIELYEYLTAQLVKISKQCSFTRQEQEILQELPYPEKRNSVAVTRWKFTVNPALKEVLFSIFLYL
jgi:hypothetical protein